MSVKQGVKTIYERPNEESYSSEGDHQDYEVVNDYGVTPRSHYDDDDDEVGFETY